MQKFVHEKRKQSNVLSRIDDCEVSLRFLGFENFNFETISVELKIALCAEVERMKQTKNENYKRIVWVFFTSRRRDMFVYVSMIDIVAESINFQPFTNHNSKEITNIFSLMKFLLSIWKKTQIFLQSYKIFKISLDIYVGYVLNICFEKLYW